MKEYKKEIWVGLFVFSGIVLLILSSIFFTNGGVIVGKYYTINALFTNVSGLQYGAPVRIAGVPIGTVDSINLNKDGTMAHVRFSIKKGIHLPEDSIAVIKSSGLLGGKYVQVLLGSSTKTLVNGGELFETQAPVDLEDLLGKYVFGSTQ